MISRRTYEPTSTLSTTSISRETRCSSVGNLPMTSCMSARISSRRHSQSSAVVTGRAGWSPLQWSANNSNRKSERMRCVHKRASQVPHGQGVATASTERHVLTRRLKLEQKEFGILEVKPRLDSFSFTSTHVVPSLPGEPIPPRHPN